MTVDAAGFVHAVDERPFGRCRVSDAPCLVAGCQAEAVVLLVWPNPEGPAAIGHVCAACAGLVGDEIVETGLGTRKVYAKADLVDGWRLGARSGRPEDLRLRAPVAG